MYHSKGIAVVLAFVFVTAQSAAQSLPPSPNTTPRKNVADAHTDSTTKDSKPNENHPTKEDGDLADLSIEELMNVQVVVTASRKVQKISTVAYPISVITADDIRASGARSVPDALRLVPGVDVADLTFGNAAVSPRGFHGFIASHLLVLVDGRQIYDPLFGGTLWGGWPFQMEDIERIEVIRGPGGVTWGANAMNGVINIITKDPADQQGTILTIGGGSRGTFKQHIGHGFTDGKLRMRISGEYEASDGFNKGGSRLRGLEDDFKGGRLSLHAIYEKDEKNTYTFSLGSTVVDGGFAPTPLAGIGQRNNASNYGFYALFNWVHQYGPGDNLDFTTYFNDSTGSPGISQIDYRYHQLGMQLSRSYEVKKDQSRVMGIDGRIDYIDDSNSDPHMLYHTYTSTVDLSLYIQDEWKLSPRWTLNLGGRIEYEAHNGFHPSGRASLSYKLSDDSLIYTSISNAHRLPTSGGRFLNIPLLNGIVAATTNRDFSATHLIAFDMGYRGKLFGLLETSLNIFWHDYKDLGMFIPKLGPPGLLRYDYDNVSGHAFLYGLEIETKYRASEKLTVLANYTYQQLDWNIDGSILDMDYITPPKHKAMLGARYKINDDLRLSAHLHYVDAVKSPNPANPFGSRHIDPYLRLDLNAEYEFWNDRATLSVGVKNLLDSNHYEGGTLFLNDAEVPRMVFAEVRIKLKK